MYKDYLTRFRPEAVRQPFYVMSNEGQGVLRTLAAFLCVSMATSSAIAQTFEADNGVTFKIVSTQAIRSMTDGSKNNALVMIEDDDGAVHQLVFDCEGHYVPLTSREDWRHIASRSVMAAVSRTACQRIGR